MRLTLLSQILFSSEQKAQLAFTNLIKKGHLNLYCLKSRAENTAATSWRSTSFKWNLPNTSTTGEGTQSGMLYANLMSNIIYTYLYFSPMPLAVLSWGKNSLSMLQYQNTTLSSTVRSFLRYNVQSFKENKPKGTFNREYFFQTSLWTLFINYKRKHVKFPQGLFLDHRSLIIYLRTFFPLISWWIP